MAANTVPIFPKAPKMAVAQISTANTNRDGSGTIVDILTGSTEGDKIHAVTITATGTTTAGVVRLFLQKDSSTYLLAEILVEAITPSTTVSVFSKTLTFDNLWLESGQKLRASTHNAETFNVFAFYGSY